MTQGNGLMHLCCTHALTHLQYTHHTHPLIVTDRAERGAVNHHDESLTRKKNGDRVKELTGEEGLRENDRQENRQGVERHGYCDVI